MEFKEHKIIITDENIISFYKENNNLNFLTLNYILIDILKNLSSNLNENINNTINSNTYNLLNNLCRDFELFKTEYNHKNLENLNLLNERLINFKRDYFEDIKLFFTNNNHNNFDKINNTIEKCNELLYNKTINFMNDIIPKTQVNCYSQLEKTINELFVNLNNQTNILIRNLGSINNDENQLQNHFNNFERQIGNILNNIQQPILTYIKSSEERTYTNLDLIKEKIGFQQNIQDRLSNELNEFLNKYKYNSSLKGNISETQLYNILLNIFPSDEIIDCRNFTANCDYKVNRLDKNKPTILFENKDYNRSVTTDEVEKFIRDIKLQKNHGIFLSQNTPITYKENFQIDIVDNLILIYIHNVNYNQEKIQIAVDIIDSLNQKLKLLDEDEKGEKNIIINKEDIENLTLDYNEFNKQKSNLLDLIKISNKQIIDKIEEMQVYSIKKILIKNDILEPEEDFKCKFCKFSGKNKASLAAHFSKCKSNPTKNSLSKNSTDIPQMEIKLDNSIILNKNKQK